MLKTFVKNNKNTAIEIVALQDLGYMLADNQADLTIKQKLFLNIAIPMVREEQEKEQERTNKGASASNSLKNRVRAKRKEQLMEELP